MLSNNYFLPFLGSDRSIVQRTQRFFYENDKKRPIQMHAYFGITSIFGLIGIAIVGAVFSLLTRYKCGRELLLKYPKLFSLGAVTHDEIKEEKMQKQTFKFTLIGEGWPKGNELSESSDKYTDPPKKKVIVEVKGTNPGYGATCVSLLTAAKTVINETTKIPGQGGVLTTGAAFTKTNIISELTKSGLTFELK